MYSKLAVVIPAYKKQFFEKALSSLANQTNKNFTVYVGDDNSPDNLKFICDLFNERLDIKYTKFENNIGAKYLVDQWSRCIDLAGEEDWLWLFSDDDIADENCVENFYKELDKNGDTIDVYRFNTVVINKEGKITDELPESPYYEPSEKMAYNLLLGKRGNSMPDHIFSKKVYKKHNGFVFTYYAQGADWAISILFSSEKGLITIPGSKLYWRRSGINISSEAASKKSIMLKGHLQFIGWATNHFQYLKGSQVSLISYEMIQTAAQKNLETIIIYHYKGISLKDYYPVVKVMHNNLQMHYKDVYKSILLINIACNNTFNFTYRKLRSLKNLLTGKN